MKISKILFILLFTIFLQGCAYHIFKPMPKGTDYESDFYYLDENEVDFLYDLSLKTGESRSSEQEIFDKIFYHIDEAKAYILIDMFLFNTYTGKDEKTYRKITEELSEKLINKIQASDIKIDFITDPVNTVYGGAKSKELTKMKKAGINVIVTDLDKMPDSNVVYSVIWRTFFQWFGNSEKFRILPNPFSSESKVSVRSYLKLLNFKANHRKVFVADYQDSWATVITSANPHDGSSAHSNVAILVLGDFAEEIFHSENSVANFSSSKLSYKINVNQDQNKKKIKLKLITEKKIKDNLIHEINSTTNSDSIKIGMFYLSDRDVIKSLIRASKRDVSIKLILDPNKDAFGRKKNGIPNRPVAYELNKKSKSKIQIKWFSTHGEQFHSKIIFFDKASGEDVIILGSANLTKRNIDDKNLETDVLLKAHCNSEFVKEVYAYYNRIWYNDQITLDYSVYAERSYWKSFLYRISEFLGSSTF